MGERHTKVLKLHILKPVGGMDWRELAGLLRDARYRVFRLANLAVSEAYLNFHRWRSGEKDTRKRTVGELNKELRELLLQEGVEPGRQDRFSKNGALAASVTYALSQYKLRGVTAPSKWKEVLRGQSSLPTYRLDMAIPLRCDKPNQRRLVRGENGDVEVELMICMKPYPKVMIATARNAVGDGQRDILERLLDGSDGYRHRCFEIKEDKRSRKWHLFVTYDFPAAEPSPHLSKERIVGVDLGVSCPLFAAVNTGYARLGRRHFAPLGARVRALQNQTIRRRREIQRGGRVSLSNESARSGHGRSRKLKAIGKLEGKIDRAYTTLNHQMSAAVVKFAKDNGAGVIQIEDLSGLADELTGTFLGQRWRYEEFQRFTEYKAAEAGIELQKVNPRYTSRRCSKCGHIHMEFTRQFRDANRKQGMPTRFKCPECEFETDPDYNAARNLATFDIESIITNQLEKQGVKKEET